MGTLGGFPNPPALWLRRAKLASANAVMGTLGGFPNPPALWLRRAKLASANAVMGTLGGFPNPPALWLRRAKRASANAVMGTLGGFASPSAPANPPCQRGRRDQKALDSPLALDELKQRAALVAHALLQLGVTPPLLPKFLGDLQGGQDGERLGVSGASLLLQIAQVFVDVGGHLAHHAFILVAAQGETMTGNADTDWALHAIPRTSTLPSAGPRVSPVPRAELGFAARVGVSTTGQRGQPQ